MLALAMGYRASQLAVLTRHCSFSLLEEGYSALTRTPSPTFLAKDEQAGNLINRIKICTFWRKEASTYCARSGRSRST